MPLLKSRLLQSSGDLTDDLEERDVLRGKGDLSLRLDLKSRIARSAKAFEYKVIERIALLDTLEADPGQSRAGHSPRLAAGEHGQEVKRPELALDVNARSASGRRTGPDPPPFHCRVDRHHMDV